MFDFDESQEHNDNHYNFTEGYFNGFPLNDADKRPTVSYLYVDTTGVTDYNFKRAEFGEFEAKIYLEKMRNYSQKTLNSLIDYLPPEEHFKVSSNPSSKELELISTLLDVDIKKENIPLTGHFALYTTPYEEGVKSKSPRIFFLVGNDCVIHILFFDPYHEIIPMGEETKKALNK